MILVEGRVNDGRRSIIKGLMHYLNKHNYFNHGIFILDCKSEIGRNTKWKFNDIIYSKLKEFGIDFSEIEPKNKKENNKKTKIQYILPKVANALEPLPSTLLTTISTTNSYFSSAVPKTPSIKRIIKVIAKLNICIIIFNVDHWNNDDAYHWIDRLEKYDNSNVKCKCIFTMKTDTQQSINKKTNIMKTSKIPTTKNIKEATSVSLTNNDSIKSHTITVERHLSTNSVSVSKYGSNHNVILKREPDNVEFAKSELMTHDLSKPTNNQTFLTMFENWISFKKYTIKGLNKNDISKLFAQRCYFRFNQNEIENHQLLQRVIDGKPGYCIKAAAFYLWYKTSTEENPQQITIDALVEKLRSESGWLREFRVKYIYIFCLLCVCTYICDCVYIYYIQKTAPKYFKENSRSIDYTRSRSIRSISSRHNLSTNPYPISFTKTKHIPRISDDTNKDALPLWINEVSVKSNRSVTPIIYEEKEDGIIDQERLRIQATNNIDELLPFLEQMDMENLKKLLTSHFMQNPVSMDITQFPDTPQLAVSRSVNSNDRKPKKLKKPQIEISYSDQPQSMNNFNDNNDEKHYLIPIPSQNTMSSFNSIRPPPQETTISRSISNIASNDEIDINKTNGKPARLSTPRPTKYKSKKATFPQPETNDDQINFDIMNIPDDQDQDGDDENDEPDDIEINRWDTDEIIDVANGNNNNNNNNNNYNRPSLSMVQSTTDHTDDDDNPVGAQDEAKTINATTTGLNPQILKDIDQIVHHYFTESPASLSGFTYGGQPQNGGGTTDNTSQQSPGRGGGGGGNDSNNGDFGGNDNNNNNGLSGISGSGTGDNGRGGNGDGNKDNNRKHDYNFIDDDDDDDDEEDKEEEEEDEEEKQEMILYNGDKSTLNPNASDWQPVRTYIEKQDSKLDTIPEEKCKKIPQDQWIRMFEPHPLSRAKGNIMISDKMIDKIIGNKTIEGEYILNKRRYIDLTTAITQWYKQKQIDWNGKKIKIINYDFHEKDTNEILYCVLLRKSYSNSNEQITQNRKYGEWTMIEALFTEKQLRQQYGILCDKLLPKSPRIYSKELPSSYNFISYKNNKDKILNDLMMNPSKIEKIIYETKWTKKQIKCRKDSRRRMTLSLDKLEFQNRIKQHCLNNDINLIPILMFNNNKNNDEYWIEYIWIIRIDDILKTDIGISLIYNSDKSQLKVNGIHLVKEWMINQHQLISPKHNMKCICFDNFTSNITNLSIGNPDDHLNKMKALKKSNQELKIKNDKLQKRINELEKLSSRNINIINAETQSNTTDSSAIAAFGAITPSLSASKSRSVSFAASTTSSSVSQKSVFDPKNNNNNNNNNLSYPTYHLSSTSSSSQQSSSLTNIFSNISPSQINIIYDSEQNDGQKSNVQPYQIVNINGTMIVRIKPNSTSFLD